MHTTPSSDPGHSDPATGADRDRTPQPPGRRAVRLILVAVAGLSLAVEAGAQAQKPSRPAPDAPTLRPGYTAEQTPPVLPDPPVPVSHAETVGLGQCAPMLDRMAKRTLTHTYDVQSGWSARDPARHIFQSVAAVTNPGNAPADGIVALVAAPVIAGGCDGVAVQVFPLAVTCQNAQKAMLADGKLLAPLLNTRIMQDRNGHRVVLLPAHNDTCVAVAVDSFFAGDAEPGLEPPRSGK